MVAVRWWLVGWWAEVVAEKLNTIETRGGPGSTLLAIACEGWKNTTLKEEDAIKAAGGPELWLWSGRAPRVVVVVVVVADL